VKHLPKHLQPRWRYLAVGIETWLDTTIDRSDLQRALWRAARSLLGDAGSARLDLTVLSADVSGGTGGAVIRTHRGEAERARAVVATVTEVDGHEVGLWVRGTSGTVRACEEKYMGRRPEKPDQRDVVFRDAERSASVRGGRVDVRTGGSFTGATALDLG
jgi:ribonuclease P/MRP protein subunit POP5